MKQKLEAWCYGGKSRVFYTAQREAVHQYNTKMMERLLLVMTMIIGAYLVAGTGSGLATVMMKYLAGSADHIYLALGLSSEYFYPHLFLDVNYL